MAVRRTKKAATVLPAPKEISDVTPVVESRPVRSGMNKMLIGLVLFLVLLVLFWYKTNSWPVVALVGMRPVTRFEINQTLFKQAGKTQVDDVVTELLVVNELNKNKISITPAQIDAKISEIRTQIGSNGTLEDILKTRNMTMVELRKQLGLQMGIEKLLKEKIVVNETEINEYITKNKAYMTGTTDEALKSEAVEAITMSKYQEEVSTWISDLNTKNKVWKLPGM